jgi:molybdopterin converting factor small subunit
MRIQFTDSRVAFAIAFDKDDLVDVEHALLAATQKEPETHPRWCDHEGQLRANLEVFLNGENIRYLEGMATQLSDGDEIHVIAHIAGG